MGTVKLCSYSNHLRKNAKQGKASNTCYILVSLYLIWYSQRMDISHGVASVEGAAKN